MCIERIRQFYDIPRKFRIMGPSGEEEFTSYSNANLGVQQLIALPYFQTKESLTFDKVIYPWFLAEYQNIRDTR